MPRLARAVAETEDASRVLAEAGLHPDVVAHLGRTRALARKALASHFLRDRSAREALRELEQARDRVLAAS